MAHASLEHLNYTVTDPLKAAEELRKIFGWHIRWQGPSLGGGHTVHVGTDNLYLALYTPPHDLKDSEESYSFKGGLNHVGVLVDDLKTIEARVKDIGYVPQNHQTYEPGSRFYFYTDDQIEFEVVSYAAN